LDVGLDVDGDVPEEAQGKCERERVALAGPELHGAGEGVGGGRIVAQPVPGFPDSCQRAGLPHTPSSGFPRQLERALVVVDRGAALYPPPRPVARLHQCIGGPVGQRAVIGIEIQGGERRKLQVAARPGWMAGR
jgi:hypothetical protein